MSENRRSFLKQTGVGVAGATISHTASQYAPAAGANERVNIGLIGCGGRGVKLGKVMGAHPQAAIRYVCDPDEHRAARAQEATGADDAVTDLRRILDDKSIDAIVIAACDHWHAPAAVLGCDSGKHVYVEKPCSHSVREGRLIVEAARRNDRLVQHGTQSRSANSKQSAIQLLRDGVIGDVLIAKHINSQKRSNIGHHQASGPPPHLNYDLWVGPAEWSPFQSNYVHYNWHWFYNFGTGDIGNDGVHGIDVARWGLGVETHPSFVAGYGSKLYFDDDQQFPDTYQITFEYPGGGSVGDRRLLIYEQRIWSPYHEHQDASHIIFYGTDGMMKVCRSTIEVYGPKNKPLQTIAIGADDSAHQNNFIAAIREGEKLHAEIAVGHLSATLCHLGNIVSRVNRAVQFDPDSEQIVGDDQANALTQRKYRKDHWARLS